MPTPRLFKAYASQSANKNTLSLRLTFQNINFGQKCPSPRAIFPTFLELHQCFNSLSAIPTYACHAICETQAALSSHWCKPKLLLADLLRLKEVQLHLLSSENLLHLQLRFPEAQFL
ncbi:unnamed protein product [Prunus armeniaca]